MIESPREENQSSHGSFDLVTLEKCGYALSSEAIYTSTHDCFVPAHCSPSVSPGALSRCAGVCDVGHLAAIKPRKRNVGIDGDLRRARKY
jgi:hypothetical protein